LEDPADANQAVQNDIVPDSAGDFGALSIDFTQFGYEFSMDNPGRTSGACNRFNPAPGGFAAYINSVVHKSCR